MGGMQLLPKMFFDQRLNAQSLSVDELECTSSSHLSRAVEAPSTKAETIVEIRGIAFSCIKVASGDCDFLGRRRYFRTLSKAPLPVIRRQQVIFEMQVSSVQSSHSSSVAASNAIQIHVKATCWPAKH